LGFCLSGPPPSVQSSCLILAGPSSFFSFNCLVPSLVLCPAPFLSPWPCLTGPRLCRCRAILPPHTSGAPSPAASPRSPSRSVPTPSIVPSSLGPAVIGTCRRAAFLPPRRLLLPHTAVSASPVFFPAGLCPSLSVFDCFLVCVPSFYYAVCFPTRPNVCILTGYTALMQGVLG